MKYLNSSALPAVALSVLSAVSVATGYAQTTKEGVPESRALPATKDRPNVYSETTAGRLSPAVNGALNRIYVPNRSAGTVSVIDPTTLKVVDTLKVGVDPQHIVPSWDLQTLWVANNAEGRSDGSLTPINPRTGKTGTSIPVDDPYNLYWTIDGRYAIVVAEAFKRLDFRDPLTMKLAFSIETPLCEGINHADFSAEGDQAVFTCEFGGAITKIDIGKRKVVQTLKLSAYFDRPQVLALLTDSGKTFMQIPDPENPTLKISTAQGMPQDIRVSPDGKTLFVADMVAGGLHVVDFDSFRQVGFITTGVGAHGLYPSRDGKHLYVANRGTNRIRGKPGGKGSVSVVDFAKREVLATWKVPGGGSPDMGNVSADGKYLWLSGRYDNVVYRFQTSTGSVDKVNVGKEPHGLTVWPQPGRYSLGHTGNMR
ncbi:hypothetical protein RD110_01050 [Rhodoferax koreense]|uniref:YNCE-like beta-propeller domain-containing protein n=1 Tax=Rhodoferax koreensis TaxID=1842727 RepID=A0A1P8K313_9BURK|nr:YncE family protein [Rhodoferax koreense]APW40392.1 hypothetical protein RD110_01050 [Rhodoferax koreense]